MQFGKTTYALVLLDLQQWQSNAMNDQGVFMGKSLKVNRLFP